jgi:serine/threonine-protein kinase HipA
LSGRGNIIPRSGVQIPLPLPPVQCQVARPASINVFDNLLPDSDPIRKRVAERVGADGTDAFSLLTALGHDCIGALQFLPEGADLGFAGSIAGKPVSDDEVADIIRNLPAAPLGVGEDKDFRLSIAGAQEKKAAGRNQTVAARPQYLPQDQRYSPALP